MAALDAAADPSPQATDLRQRIEASGDQDRGLAIKLARQALTGRLNPEQSAWFLDRLGSDLRRLRRWQDALAIAQQGLALAGIDPAQRVRFATQLGYVRLGQIQAAEALRLYDQQIAKLLPALLRATDPQTRRTALDALRMRGAALLAASRNPEAMEQLTEVLRLYDAIGDAEGRAETLHVIAALRFASGDLAQALQAEQQAIDIATQGRVKGVLAKMYSLKSYLQGQHMQTEEYERTLLAARAAAIEEGDDFIQAMVTFNLSDVAIQRKDWAEALRLADSAVPTFVKIGDLNMADLARANRGIALNRSGHPEGIALLRQADQSIATRPGQEATLVAVQKALAEELAFARDFERAYAAQLEHQRRSDALRVADNQKRIAEAEASYQADRKQRQIDELERAHAEQQRFRWLWVLVGVLGVTAAAVAALSRVYLKRAYRAMHDMALEDPLTGLHNRRYLSSRIAEDLAQVRRQLQETGPLRRTREPPPATSAAFLLIDMDHFKVINDAHGHAAGDAVLKQAAAVLRRVVRQSDMLVRWGGEEFLVFAKLKMPSEAEELAERIRTQMAAHAFELGNGIQLHKTCSVGFACYPVAFHGQKSAAPAEAPSWESVVSLADQCLYAAKASGRDLWVGIQPLGPLASAPAPLNARVGVEQGYFVLAHSAGRDLLWPQT
ncbi:MAG TPA: GGDEF domain-containing protein [Burkholderiaceae bacterium]